MPKSLRPSSRKIKNSIVVWPSGCYSLPPHSLPSYHHPSTSTCFTKYKGSTILIPDFPKTSDIKLPQNANRMKVDTLLVMYRAHCENFIDAVTSRTFEQAQRYLTHFWQGIPLQMFQLLNQNFIIDIIAVCDVIVFKTITKVIIPQFLHQLTEKHTDMFKVQFHNLRKINVIHCAECFFFLLLVTSDPQFLTIGCMCLSSTKGPVTRQFQAAYTSFQDIWRITFCRVTPLKPLESNPIYSSLYIYGSFTKSVLLFGYSMGDLFSPQQYTVSDDIFRNYNVSNKMNKVSNLQNLLIWISPLCCRSTTNIVMKLIKELDYWIRLAMSGLPEKLCTVKLKLNFKSSTVFVVSFDFTQVICIFFKILSMFSKCQRTNMKERV
ncbi:Transcription factor RFX4 [Nymphon striatum]|nr:Transcription factor RFX4 [Nymphon striatum]